MTISELIAEIGDNKLRVQMLHDSFHGNQSARKKGRTQLSFLTDESLAEIMNGKRRGIVVWCDESEFQASVERLRQRQADAKADKEPADE